MGSVKESEVVEETEEDREAFLLRRRQECNPLNLTSHQKLCFVRRVALYWHSSCYQDASDKFRNQMVDRYGWTFEEAGRFLGYHNVSIEREFDFIYDWANGVE